MELLHSIIIPTCNRTLLLERAIHSVLTQSDKDFELLVVDDGDALLSTPAISDPRISYFRTDRPLSGPGVARNAALRIAKGRLVSFLDDDDVMLADFLITAAALHESHANPLMATVSNAILRHQDRCVTTKHEELRSALGDVYFLTLGIGHGFTFNRDAINQLGGFDQTYRYTEDTEFLYRFFRSGGRTAPLGSTPYFEISRSDIPRQTSDVNIEARLRECAAIGASNADILSNNAVLGARWHGYIDSLMQRCGCNVT